MRGAAAPDMRTFRPVLYDAGRPDDLQRLEADLLRAGPTIVHDAIESQLHELLESRNARKRWSPADLAEGVAAHTGGRPLDSHGVWVHYPWTRRLVHALPPDEHRELRTSRNRYKITDRQQAQLHACAIGIVGLSVGQATAVTLVLEGIGNHFRLADPDTLALSNMNRLRASMHDLGLNKCVLAAREMFEIDPYLEIDIYEEGLNDGNVERFLAGGRKLDVLIEECDDLSMKIFARHRARALRIPVVMDTNDRGMVDIERFDLEPDRPIFHGLLGQIGPDEVRGLPKSDQAPYLLKMLGEMSAPLVASLFEIDETLKSWPQLASGVALGGAVTTDAVRRIVLDELRTSGRFFVDMEAIVRDGGEVTLAVSVPLPEQPAKEAEIPPAPPLAAPAFPPSNDDLRNLAGFGLLAPSGGNVQPWRFVARRGELSCEVDPSRAQTLLDFQRSATFLSIGAAVENIALAARSVGLATAVEVPDDGDHPERVCRLSFERAAPLTDPLFHEIARRSTNRRAGPRVALAHDHRARLEQAADLHGARLQMLASESALEELAGVVAAGDLVRLFSEPLHAEMMSELRWTRESAEATRDGIDVRTLELPRADLAGMKLAASYGVMEFLRREGLGGKLAKSTKRSIVSASAMALVTVAGSGRAAAVRGGRAVQRVWLAATQLGLAVQPVVALLYLFARMERGNGEGLSDLDLQALRPLRERFQRLFEVRPDESEVFLFRLGNAGLPTVRALRRRVEDLFVVEDP